jgi:hypothetical protein
LALQSLKVRIAGQQALHCAAAVVHNEATALFALVPLYWPPSPPMRRRHCLAPSLVALAGGSHFCLKCMVGNDDHSSCFSFRPMFLLPFDPSWMHFAERANTTTRRRKGPDQPGDYTENRDFHLILASGCIHAPPPTPTTHMYQLSEGELPSALHFLLRLPVESSTILLVRRLCMKCQGRCRPASRTALPYQTGGRAGERASSLTIQHAPPRVPSAYD